MRRKYLVGVFLAILLGASGAIAQEQRQEVSVQGTGFFTKDSNGNGINQHSTDTGGLLVSYRYHFNRWLVADASYGYVSNTQQNFTSTTRLDVEANVHQATGALVVTVPDDILKFKPYVLAGAGGLVFDPTGKAGGFIPGAQNQARAAFVYGGGVDYGLNPALCASR